MRRPPSSGLVGSLGISEARDILWTPQMICRVGPKRTLPAIWEVQISIRTGHHENWPLVYGGTRGYPLGHRHLGCCTPITEAVVDSQHSSQNQIGRMFSYRRQSADSTSTWDPKNLGGTRQHAN